MREQMKMVRTPVSYQFGALCVAINGGAADVNASRVVPLVCTPDSCEPFVYEHLLFIVHHIDLLFRGTRSIVDLSCTAGMLSIIADSVGVPTIAAYVHDRSVLEANLQRNGATASVWRHLEGGRTERPQLVYLDLHAFPSLALLSRALASLEENGRLVVTGLINAHKDVVLDVLQPTGRLLRETWINEWTALILKKCSRRK